ncbi:MAG: hypothetical protein ACKVXR_07850 [Planctomycetota bacterium]
MADPLSLAEEFLREAVYRSRERQSAVAAVRAAAIRNPNCGLGENAAVVLDLSPRAREIARDLGEGALQNASAVMSDWIERQDALDRKRNHFLKDFRGRHGFDRKLYGPEVLAEFDAGLARINAEEDSERRAAAERLLA